MLGVPEELRVVLDEICRTENSWFESEPMVSRRLHSDVESQRQSQETGAKKDISLY